MVRGGWVAVLLLSACSVEIPALKDKWKISPKDETNQPYVDACIERLNVDRLFAYRRRNESDAIAISGVVASAGSGLASAILAASLPNDTSTTTNGVTTTDDHRGQKIAAAVTGGFAAVSAVIAVIAKLVESPNDILKRRTAAEAHYIAGMKALRLGHTDFAMERFIDCSSANAPPDVPQDVTVPTAPAPPTAHPPGPPPAPAAPAPPAHN